MENDLQIMRRSQAADPEKFDTDFASHLPNTAIPKKAMRIKYTQTLLSYVGKRKSEFWIAIQPQSGEVIARLGADIGAIHSSVGFLEANKTEQGSFAAAILLNEAIDWLKNNGVTIVYGPMDFNSWFNYRFKKIENDVEAATNHPWEPEASRSYEDLFRTNGFKDEIRYASYFFDLTHVSQWQQHIEHLKPDYERAVNAGFKMREISTQENSEQDIRSIFEISNVAFANQPMFESIPFSMFSALTLPALTNYNATPSKICFDKNNRPVGFLFAFYLHGLIVYKSVAVLPEYQAMGIGNAMTLELCEFGLKNNVTKCVGALIRSGNKSEMFGKSFEKIVRSSGKNDYILLSRTIK